MAATLLIRRITTGTEATRILDRLESATGLNGEPVAAGRAYDLGESKDLLIAMASIRGQLDTISHTWPIHLELEVDPE